jgi:hypothetical protein
MNHAIKATAHETKVRRWTTFTPPQRTAYAAHCGLVLHWRAYICQYKDEDFKRSLGRSGEQAANWKGGRTYTTQMFRKSHAYRKWPLAVLKRDDCDRRGVSGDGK